MLEVYGLSPELHRHARPRGYVGPGRWRLLPRHAAAYGFEFEAGVLSGLYCAANGFAHKRRHFDSTLFNIQDDRSTRGQLGLRSGCIRDARTLR